MLPVKSLKSVCDTPNLSAWSFVLQPSRVISAVLVICTFFGAGSLASDLPSCAAKYGELMVDHQLTVATMRQLERLLYYQAKLADQVVPGSHYRELEDELAKTDHDLQNAAKLYAALYKSPSNDGIEKLTADLNKIARDTARND